jgi:hypothetical protein
MSAKMCAEQYVEKTDFSYASEEESLKRKTVTLMKNCGCD